jgi:hypothetical protein
MVAIAGKYKRTKCENNEEFLAKIGANFLVRKAASASSPAMEIVDLGGGKWKITTSTTLKSMTAEFELGKAFDESTPEGRSVTTTYTKEGNNKWITTQKNKKAGSPDVIVIREFTDAGINIDYTCDGVVSKQLFARQ